MAKVTQLQTSFTRMMRDVPRNAMPKGACYTLQDGLVNIGAEFRNRGGWTNYSNNVTSTIAAATQVFAPLYANQMTTPRLIAVTEDGELFHVASNGTVTDVGSVGAAPPYQMAQLGGLAVIPSSSGAAAPKKYDGTTLGNLGGSPPSAFYAATWKSLMLLGRTTAQPQRLYFSTTDNNPETWDTTNTFWDFSFPIVGLAPMRNAILVMHDEYVSRLRGSTPPPGGDLIADDPLFNIGCNSQLSIAFWGERVIWGNNDGIFITDGIIPSDLTKMCGMKSYWNSLMSSATSTWIVAGGVCNGNYVFTVYDYSNGTVKDAGMIDLRNNSWIRLTNFDATSMSRTTSLDGAERLLFGRFGAARVCEASSIWTPTASNKSDGNGTAVAYQIETPFYEFGVGLDLVRDLFVTYDLRDAASDNPTLTVSYVQTPESTSYTTAATLTETTARTRQRVTVNRVGQGLGLKLAQTNASSDSRLWELDVEGYGLEQNRLV